MSSTNDAATELARFLDGGAVPIYVLDEDRRIIYCNAACAQWLGLAAEALVGQRSSYHAPAEDPSAVDPDLAAIAAGLCPPPLAFAGEVQRGVVCHGRPGGRVVYRRGTFLPLSHGDDESAPVVAILDAEDCSPAAIAPDATSTDQLHEQVRRFRRQLAGRFTAERLIGNHPRIVRARSQIGLAARSDVNVLVVGPPGSGKEHAARAVHYGQDEPGLLVPLDCGLMEANMLRSTLRTLCARRALRPAGSSLLLENVSEMPGEVQHELVELLREGTLGMRVISKSCVPLADRVAEEAFSEDLACALGTLVIELPPLAERIEDLPLVAQAMIEELNATQLRQVAGFSAEALDRLAAYPWPGNLDELQVLVRDLHERSVGPRIGPRDLPKTIEWGAEAAAPDRGEDRIVLEDFLARVERELISRAMRKSKGNKSRAAKMLGLTRPRLYRRLVQLGLEPPKEKEGERP